MPTHPGPRVAALYVDARGIYSACPDVVDLWPAERDARLYAGPWPVVAHPPCQLWGKLAALNYSRWGGEHNRPGNDGGCFAAALAAVRTYGGVLEHPAFTRAWKYHQLQRPETGHWIHCADGGWVCEVWQSAYGHKCQKRTWLYYAGAVPPNDLLWERKPGSHHIGCPPKKWRTKPTLSGKAASATPPDFACALIDLALDCRVPQ